MSHILAFDLSTTVCGYTVFDEDTEEIKKISYYKFKGEELLDRSKELESLILKINDEFKIDKMIIEENLKSFRSGGTNASAMLNTSKMNFCCQYIMKFVHGIQVFEINVNSARSSCFPGFHKIARLRKGVKQKEIAFEMACQELGEKTFPKKILQSGVRKGTEVFLDEAGDMADSWVIGKAYLNESKKPAVVPKVKKEKKK